MLFDRSLTPTLPTSFIAFSARRIGATLFPSSFAGATLVLPRRNCPQVAIGRGGRHGQPCSPASSAWANVPSRRHHAEDQGQLVALAGRARRWRSNGRRGTEHSA